MAWHRETGVVTGITSDESLGQDFETIPPMPNSLDSQTGNLARLVKLFNSIDYPRQDDVIDSLRRHLLLPV